MLSNRLKILFLLVIIFLLALALAVGFVIGKNQVAKQPGTISVPTTTPTPTSPTLLEYTKAQHRGHYFFPMEFLYEYPTGWHVWYKSDFSEDSVGTNQFFMNPVPYEIEEHVFPVITGYSRELSEVHFSEIINEWIGDDCHDYVSNGFLPQNSCNEELPRRVGIAVPGDEDYCYRYEMLMPPTGQVSELISCVIKITDESAFLFNLNDIQRSSEFRHFIESIKGQAEMEVLPLVLIRRLGGLCPEGECSNLTTIMRDGTVKVPGSTERNADVTKLISLIEESNFTQIRSHTFEGTCPTAYDGTETTFTFYKGTETESISSCEVEIDYNLPLFAEITRIEQEVAS